jgi:5-(carboxyamino)imidazole ribonucleotide synthase
VAEGATVVTFDHEQVPTEHLRALEASGHRIAPDAGALVHAQDELVLRRFLDTASEPQPAWAHVTAAGDVARFAAEHGWPVVLKTPRGGYDGRGVCVVSDSGDAAELLGRYATPRSPRCTRERLGSNAW